MLRSTFDGLSDARQAHIDDHQQLHRRGNTVIHADDHASIAEALAAAEQYKIGRVLLTSGRTYTLTSTLVVPSEVCLDGGGAAMAALNSPRLRGIIATDAPLDPMIRLSHYSSVRGCDINGNNKAVGAILCQNSFFNEITGNLLARTKKYGLRFGGAMFATIRRNLFSSINGYAIDARRDYAAAGSSAYYGLNVGLSESNSVNALGGIWLEGILTSISDDFERGSFDLDGPYISVGGAVQSQLAMYAPYMEFGIGAYPAWAIDASNSSKISVRDGQCHAKDADSNARFMTFGFPSIVHVSGCNINRFATVFAGDCATNTNVSIFGNYYYRAQVVNAITNLASAQSVFCAWPGDKIGVI